MKTPLNTPAPATVRVLDRCVGDYRARQEQTTIHSKATERRLIALHLAASEVVNDRHGAMVRLRAALLDCDPAPVELERITMGDTVIVATAHSEHSCIVTDATPTSIAVKFPTHAGPWWFWRSSAGSRDGNARIVGIIDSISTKQEQ